MNFKNIFNKVVSDSKSFHVSTSKQGQDRYLSEGNIIQSLKDNGLTNLRIESDNRKEKVGSHIWYICDNEDNCLMVSVFGKKWEAVIYTNKTGEVE